MTRLEAVNAAYLRATNKATGPTGSNLATLNALAIHFNREWQLEPDIEWDSLYRVVLAGTVTATDTFTLATPINYISQDRGRENNFVRIKRTDGGYIDYKTVRPADLYANRNNRVVAQISPTQIQFGSAFASDSDAIGGTIQVPAIIKLDDLTDDNSLVLIDDPAWLYLRMAAQFVLPNRQLNYLYGDIMDQVNEKMDGMQGRNGRSDNTTSTGIDYTAAMGNVGNEYSHSDGMGTSYL